MTIWSDPDQLLQRTLNRPPGILQKALKAGLRLPMKAWRTSVDGLDRIPASGGVLIASNHGSYLDHFFLAFRIRRPVNFMAAAELFSNPVAARVLSALGAFPVRRGEHDSRSVETAAELVRSGRLVVIYPQGGIRPSLGTTKPKAGVGLVATSSGAPVIPAGIIDATTLHRSGFLRFPRITVRFGEGSSYIDTAAHEVAEIVWEQVIELNLRGH